MRLLRPHVRPMGQDVRAKSHTRNGSEESNEVEATGCPWVAVWMMGRLRGGGNEKARVCVGAWVIPPAHPHGRDARADEEKESNRRQTHAVLCHAPT